MLTRVALFLLAVLLIAPLPAETAKRRDRQSATALAPDYCVGDGSSGKRVRVALLYPDDQPPPTKAAVDEVRGFAEQIGAWVDLSAQETGGRRVVRWYTVKCQIHVRVLPLPRATLEGDLHGIYTAIQDAGLISLRRNVLAYVDVFRNGAGMHRHDDDRPGVENVHNLGNGVALVGRNIWNAHMGLHELAHILGAAQDSAPHANGAGHVTDGYDIIALGGTNDACPDLSAQSRRWDCNHDDYFHTDPAPGSYLATHWNLANSLFLHDPNG